MYRILLVTLIAVFSLQSCQEVMQTKITSPNGQIEVNFSIESGLPKYAITYKGEPIIEPSSIRFDLIDQKDLIGLSLISSKVDSTNESWTQPWGEIKKISNNYKQLTLRMQEVAKPYRELSIIFRAFNDGVGFRYIFHGSDTIKSMTLADELTEFNVTGDPKAWWIPADYNSYEYLFSESKVSAIDASKYEEINTGFRVVKELKAAHTPLTMEMENGVFVTIHEADLTNYPGMILKVEGDNLVSKLTPSDRLGYAAKVDLPFESPWRTIQIADGPGGLTESMLSLNLNDPNALGDISWVRPMKYMGVWWEMHLGTHTWEAGPNHGATTERVKDRMDFAAAHGFDGVLVEGWNTGWDVWLTPDRDDAFDFTTPYPGFDIREIVNYGKEKGVALIGHHETAAAVSQYESRMDTAFALYGQLGVPAVKTGYVGNIIPEGEYHHSQWMVNHYERVIETAARNKVSILAHESIKPTGKRREFPNFMARETIRGSEYNSPMGGGNPPEHLTIVPFTRMLAGPVDYTPGIFQLDYEPYGSDAQAPTTLAYQLASYVVIYSPVQMASDLPENYDGHPAFQFIKDVPVDWDNFKVLDAKIGDYAAIARNKGNDWFVGAVSDENSRELTIHFDFLEEGVVYNATIYADAETTDFEEEPMSYEITSKTIQKGDSHVIKLARGGGQAISLIADSSN